MLMPNVAAINQPLSTDCSRLCKAQHTSHGSVCNTHYVISSWMIRILPTGIVILMTSGKCLSKLKDYTTDVLTTMKNVSWWALSKWNLLILTKLWDRLTENTTKIWEKIDTSSPQEFWREIKKLGPGKKNGDAVRVGNRLTDWFDISSSGVRQGDNLASNFFVIWLLGIECSNILHTAETIKLIGDLPLKKLVIYICFIFFSYSKIYFFGIFGLAIMVTFVLCICNIYWWLGNNGEINEQPCIGWWLKHRHSDVCKRYSPCLWECCRSPKSAWRSEKLVSQTSTNAKLSIVAQLIIL